MTDNKDIVKCIRITRSDNEMIAYLKSLKVNHMDFIYPIIHEVLVDKCKEYRMKEKRIKDAPDWLYDD